MARIDNALAAGLMTLGDKPSDKAIPSQKKRYSERMSQVIANVFADELRHRGLDGALPAPPGVVDRSGAERRMAGGIGAKKVDVTWATQESGLLLGISVKTINFRTIKRKKGNGNGVDDEDLDEDLEEVDGEADDDLEDGTSSLTQGSFQKNLINRRGDMLIEAVTLHRRFPYAVLAGFLFLDKDAALDNTKKRRSTFINAHNRFRLFTGRNDPAGRDEQYERMYIGLVDASSNSASVKLYSVGDPENEVQLEKAFDELLKILAQRNPDFYEYSNGRLRKVPN